MARGWMRFCVGPSFTKAWATSSRSTSRTPWFWVAFAMADRSTFSTTRAACRRVSCTCTRALFTSRPRIRSATSRAF